MRFTVESDPQDPGTLGLDLDGNQLPTAEDRRRAGAVYHHFVAQARQISIEESPSRPVHVVGAAAAVVVDPAAAEIFLPDGRETDAEQETAGPESEADDVVTVEQLLAEEKRVRRLHELRRLVHGEVSARTPSPFEDSAGESRDTESPPPKEDSDDPDYDPSEQESAAVTRRPRATRRRPRARAAAAPLSFSPTVKRHGHASRTDKAEYQHQYREWVKRGRPSDEKPSIASAREALGLFNNSRKRRPPASGRGVSAAAEHATAGKRRRQSGL